MSSPYTGAQPPSPAAHQPPAQQNHSLAFRVMRLSRPSLQPDPAALLRFDPRDVFLPEDALTSPDPSAAADFLHCLLHPPDSISTTVPGDFTFRDRFLLRDPADALALPGLLVLPQSFGAIYLGETFCSYISINNSSSFEAREVIINVRTIKNETLIAIKAPHGSRLEVPDPDEAGDYLQRRYRIVIRSTMGSIDLYLVSKFEEKMEELIGVATTPRHANVAKPAFMEGFRTTEAGQSSRPKEALPNIQHIEKTPDLNASHDFGGMTRITPDVDADADYWLLTDGDVSITDMWKTAPEVQWDQIDTNIFLAEEVSTPCALNQQPSDVGEPTAAGSNHG